MKKIIALALALIMALSMASVAFAAVKDEDTYTELDPYTTFEVFPGEKYQVSISLDNTTTFLDDVAEGKQAAKNYKLSWDFTKGDFDGASYIKDIRFNKQKTAVVIELKESYTMALENDKILYGQIIATHKTLEHDDGTDYAQVLGVKMALNNGYESFEGAKKADDADYLTAEKNFVNIFEKAGYVGLEINSELTGVAKVEKNDKVYFNTVDLEVADEDSYDALMAALGEDYEGIVEMVSFETKAAEDVAWTYKAWEEDPHFFYAWDGEKLTAIDAKYDADEDVDAYVFTADAANTILVVDTEIVLAAEETKNPDTGANDVVGVAAALAVVSLVAAGAVSLKK